MAQAFKENYQRVNLCGCFHELHKYFEGEQSPHHFERYWKCGCVAHSIRSFRTDKFPNSNELGQSTTLKATKRQRARAAGCSELVTASGGLQCHLYD